MKFRLSGEFGELSPVRNWQPHTGIDVAIPEGTTLRAVGEGVIDRVFDGADAIGKGLSIQFLDGSRAIYGHMNEVQVREGEHINAGDIIGESGNTGNSTGPHLHFGLKDVDGSPIDPTPMADQLMSITGDNPHYGVLGKLAAIGTESIREKAADYATETLLGVLDALKDIILSGTLLGAGILILLRVAGWKDGGRWTGVLVVVNILFRYLFGAV
ncbi:M23 family metallopeptidase [Bacillus infantis]|uniref:M23 family metallopeptidase n=1 Tax=Bacillus infantis TaxID=324767 RepID=UPI00344C2876